MAFTPLEQVHVRQTMAGLMTRRRPPEEIRDRVDLEYRISGQSVEVVERRPAWRSPGETTETPVAKLTYVRSRDAWKIFWMRRDLRWHGYDPAPQVESLATALRIVDRDEYGCFWG